ESRTPCLPGGGVEGGGGAHGKGNKEGLIHRAFCRAVPGARQAGGGRPVAGQPREPTFRDSVRRAWRLIDDSLTSRAEEFALWQANWTASRSPCWRRTASNRSS